MENILLCWLGRTDLDASQGKDVGLGPIAQVAVERDYREIVLLNNWPKKEAKNYKKWLQEHTRSKITISQQVLSGPTNYEEIYRAASLVSSKKKEEYGDEINLSFHLSPGTPAMAAVWMLLSKTQFPADLIESSIQSGVSDVTIPFEISADFIPDLLKKSDQILERLAAGLPSDAPEFNKIIYRSEEMKRVILRARHVALRSVPVLIEGESGTGKELFARAIHDASPRSKKPFITINCGAIPKELVESELFGHEKGAFTDAQTARVGHFESAHGGTVFLDEIGELPLEMQVKMLRFVQEGEIRRVGSTQTKHVDVRIVAATNRILIQEVAAGAFREDLFYRLAVAIINLPPLRERVGDTSLLVDWFLDKINKESRNEPRYRPKTISASAKNILMQHQWPGNVRELQNTLTRAVVWSLEEELSERHITEALQVIPDGGAHQDTILYQDLSQGIDLPEIMKAVAVHYLERGLAQNNGNKSQTAKTLGLPSYQTLTNWLKKYGLE